MTVEIVGGQEGITVVDDIERRRTTLLTADAVEPSPVPSDEFRFPVDAAAAVETSAVTLPEVVNTQVRAADGEVVAGVGHFESHAFEAGVHFVEFSAPVKLYLRVDGPVTVRADAAEITVDLGRTGEIRVGARSYHDRPAATVTTTGRPVDVMRAVSALGSALKTTTPDRSYPTLRGHPPELVLGDALTIPPEIARPDTGVRIEVPPRLEDVYPVAPLAYYLGAEVVPGEVRRLVADGFAHPLDAPDGRPFEAEVARVLKQTFFLDCLTRTEGSTGLVLHEREALDGTVDLPYGRLGDADPAERLRHYLDVPFEAVEPHLPRWKLTAHVSPAPEHVEILPFLVDDLAVVRTPESGSSRSEVERSEAERASVESYLRTGATEDGAFVRGTTRAGGDRHLSTVQPGETDSLEQAWVGEEAPVGASKATVEAYRNRLSRRESGDGVDIVVVCNDEEMMEELESAGAVYGSREELPFEVTAYTGLTTDRLRLVLESDVDFLHYVGHIDEGGFQCTDGTLDARTLDTVGVDAFFLNACASYEQGMELIGRGAIGGVVTLAEVINSGALRVGKTMARLLDRGFPLRPALDIASERSIVGNQYIVVGDGNVDLVHAVGLSPNLAEVTTLDDSYRLDVRTYFTGQLGVGSMYRPEVADNEAYFLIGSRRMGFEVDERELRDYLDLEVIPVTLDGEFTWSNGIDLDGV